MTRPYSEVSRLRSRISTSKCGSRATTSRAIVTSRQVFDDSPGQVFSLRLALLISRIREDAAGSFCCRSAFLILSLAAIQSCESW
jgi:hypothetical protein